MKFNFNFTLYPRPTLVALLSIVAFVFIGVATYYCYKYYAHMSFPSRETWANDVNAYLAKHTLARPAKDDSTSPASGEIYSKELSSKEPEMEVELKDPEEYYALAELYHHGKFGKSRDPQLASQHYRKCIERTRDTALKGKCHIALAQLHESDAGQNGDAVHRVIEHYLLALECGYEECVVHIGKMYLNGMHPYVLPDKMVAARIFSSFSRFSPSVEPWCKLHLQEIHGIRYQDLDAVPSPGVRYAALPHDILERMHMACDRMNGPPIPYKSSFNRSLLRDYDAEDREERARTRWHRAAGGRRRQTQSVLLRLPEQTVKNDTQNVHDHSVQNLGNQIIDTLQTQVKAAPSDFQSNKQALLSHVDEAKHPHVRRVCDSLNPDFVHSRFNKTEADVFNLMWTKVKDDPDKRDIFIDSLNSGIEHGHVVCSTGKIMRMLSSLDATDDSVPDLKPDWAIRQEILAVISNTIDNLNKTEKRRYESDNNDAIKSVIGDRVRERCRKEYEGVLAPELLDMHLNEYLEYI